MIPSTRIDSSTKHEIGCAVIFANGDPPNPETALRYGEGADLLLAADGGTRHAMALDLIPHVVIGDLDSLDADHQTRLQAGGTQFIVHPAAKDESDLELALLYAVGQGADSIVVLAALGGRLDQTLANVLLLAMPVLIGRDVRLIDGPQTAFVVRGEATIDGKPGDTVSFIPLGGSTHGITTSGLAFPLAEGTIPFGPALGLSNEMTASRASIQVRDGLLLCVHISRQEKRRD